MKIKILGKIKRLKSGEIVVPEYVRHYSKGLIIEERHLSPGKAKNCFLRIGYGDEIFRIKPSPYDDPAESWDSILNTDEPHRFIIFEKESRTFWKVFEGSESLEKVGNAEKLKKNARFIPDENWDAIKNSGLFSDVSDEDWDAMKIFMLRSNASYEDWDAMKNSGLFPDISDEVWYDMKNSGLFSYVPDENCDMDKLLGGLLKWVNPDDIKKQHWFFKGHVVYVEEDERERSHEELKLEVSNAIIKQDKRYNQLKRQLQAFGSLEKANEKRRERISDEVRLFVWQRDEGKCVKCGSNEKLEFDHIIPIVKGGNNTERNVQLLCERCNREKSSKL